MLMIDHALHLYPCENKLGQAGLIWLLLLIGHLYLSGLDYMQDYTKHLYVQIWLTIVFSTINIKVRVWGEGDCDLLLTHC